MLDRIAGFPRREARIVALLGPTPAGLGATALRLAERLRGEGFEVEHRPFKLHVTLARMREAIAVPERRILPLHVMAKEIRLYESELLPGGARYHVVSAYPLPDRKGSEA